ncbi:MAG: ABC transporter ATP-binding protein [bacterium]|nr:ABC transporter ATP-binding protein [bacterium]
MQPADSDQRTNPTPFPLRVVAVSRSFDGLTAVNQVSFTLAAGERLAILGPNGAGKSTLFNLVCGDLSADSGRVFLRGEDVTGLALHHRVRRGLARTYQTSSVFAGLTVREHLALARRGPGLGRLSLWPQTRGQAQMAEAALALAARVGLEGRIDHEASELSHGELRQLEVAMALATDPHIILLDEPAAGLSPAEREQLTSLLLSLDTSVAVVLVEHDMDVALTVADRVLVLESGRLIAEGKPEEIEADPIVRAVYLGEQHDQHQESGR